MPPANTKYCDRQPDLMGPRFPGARHSRARSAILQPGPSRALNSPSTAGQQMADFKAELEDESAPDPFIALLHGSLCPASNCDVSPLAAIAIRPERGRSLSPGPSPTLSRRSSPPRGSPPHPFLSAPVQCQLRGRLPSPAPLQPRSSPTGGRASSPRPTTVMVGEFAISSVRLDRA
jgi:hypothetical protein